MYPKKQAGVKQQKIVCTDTVSLLIFNALWQHSWECNMGKKEECWDPAPQKDITGYGDKA